VVFLPHRPASRSALRPAVRPADGVKNILKADCPACPCAKTLLRPAVPAGLGGKNITHRRRHRPARTSRGSTSCARGRRLWPLASASLCRNEDRPLLGPPAAPPLGEPALPSRGGTSPCLLGRPSVRSGRTSPLLAASPIRHRASPPAAEIPLDSEGVKKLVQS